LRGAAHPSYSLNAKPCDFRAFGTMKGKIKDRYLDSPEEMPRVIQEAWSYLTFEDFQNVFKSSMERLTWVIANNGEYYHEKSLGM
jgi:hypothetical protein